jgi:hypothetical protein
LSRHLPLTMRLPHTLLILATAWLEVLAAPTDSLSASSFYVPSLPGLWGHPPSLKIWAGHINSDPDAAKAKPTDVTSHLYFVLTKARRTLDKERVVFWFNGGPGCSSFDGLMMEVGPWRMDGKGGLKFQEGGWEEYTHVVYGLSLSSNSLFFLRLLIVYCTCSGSTRWNRLLLRLLRQIRPRAH